jgi:hypothetical protein
VAGQLSSPALPEGFAVVSDRVRRILLVEPEPHQFVGAGAANALALILVCKDPVFKKIVKYMSVFYLSILERHL